MTTTNQSSPPFELVGQPWREGDTWCVQLRVPQTDGSNVEPIVRLEPGDLTDLPDDAIAEHLGQAAAAAADDQSSDEVPAALARLIASRAVRRPGRGGGPTRRHAGP